MWHDDVAKIYQRVLWHGTIKCHINEPLKLRYKYIAELNVYNQNSHFETYMIQL